GLWGADISNPGRLALLLCREFHADSAIADKAAGLVEHGFAAHLELLLRAIGVDAAEDEIEERLPRCNRALQRFPFRLVPAGHLSSARIRRERGDSDSEHLQHRA